MPNAGVSASKMNGVDRERRLATLAWELGMRAPDEHTQAEWSPPRLGVS